MEILLGILGIAGITAAMALVYMAWKMRSMDRKMSRMVDRSKKIDGLMKTLSTTPQRVKEKSALLQTEKKELIH